MSPIEHNPALVPPGVARARAPARPEPARQGPSFQDVLRGQTAGVRFSGHALARVERRAIELTAPTLARLEQGVARAASKGSRDAVVFVDGTAFVVSVHNRTVITAVDNEHMREHVFTNIDSAVIA